MKPEFNHSELSGDTLVTPAEAAAILAVSKATLARWRSEGRPEPVFVKVGTWAVRYPLGSLRGFIQDNRSEFRQ